MSYAGDVHVRLRDLHGNVKIRLAVLFVDRIIEKAVVPLMAIRFAQTLGVRVAGVVLVTVVVVSVAPGILGGYVADRVGRRPILVASESTRVVALVGMCLSVAGDADWVAAGFLLLLMVAAGVASPASEATLIDVTLPHQLHRVYTLSYWVSNLSLTLGPLIGVVVYPRWFPQTIAFFAVLSAVMTLVVVRAMRETLPRSNDIARPGLLRSYRTVVRDWTFLLYFLAVAVVASLSMQPSHYIGVRLALDVNAQPVRLAGIDTTLTGVGLSGIQRAANSLTVILFAVVIGRLAARSTVRVRFLVGLVIYGVGLAAVVITERLELLLLATLIFSLGELLFGPSQLTLLARLAPQEVRSQYIAVSDLRYRVGAVVGAASVPLVGYASPTTMAVLYVLAAAATIPLFWAVDRAGEQRAHPEAPRPTLVPAQNPPAPHESSAGSAPPPTADPVARPRACHQGRSGEVNPLK